MEEEGRVLCAASAYEKKFYFNEDEFGILPEEVKDELKMICVSFTEDVGGVLTLQFDENGDLLLITSAEEEDLLYDDIGSTLKIRKLQHTQDELFGQLESYYRAAFLGEEYDDDSGY